MTRPLPSRPCPACGQSFTPNRKDKQVCSRACRHKLDSQKRYATRVPQRGTRKPTADQRVAVIPAYEEVQIPARQFTDAEFYALIGPRKPRNDNGERMPMVTRTAAKRDTDESGICPVCGKAYTFPLRREGWRGCSLACWEAARLEVAA